MAKGYSLSDTAEEREFWVKLEFRVCREIDALSDINFRGIWCDGFIPERRAELDGRTILAGRVWMGFGGRKQELWDFSFVHPSLGRGELASIDWATLVPAECMTGWLSLDRIAGTMRIDPATARPDLQFDAE